VLPRQEYGRAYRRATQQAVHFDEGICERRRKDEKENEETGELIASEEMEESEGKAKEHQRERGESDLCLLIRESDDSHDADFSRGASCALSYWHSHFNHKRPATAWHSAAGACALCTPNTPRTPHRHTCV
jgi:hypothetical protein